MKHVIVSSLVVLLAACGGTPKNMATKTDLGNLESDLRSEIKQVGLDLERSLTEAKGKLPDILTAETRVSQALEDLKKLKEQVVQDKEEMAGLVKAARADMLKILEAEEKLLTDRLATLREVIEELRQDQ